jgi:hypothetical protein
MEQTFLSSFRYSSTEPGQWRETAWLEEDRSIDFMKLQVSFCICASTQSSSRSHLSLWHLFGIQRLICQLVHEFGGFIGYALQGRGRKWGQGRSWREKFPDAQTSLQPCYLHFLLRDALFSVQPDAFALLSSQVALKLSFYPDACASGLANTAPPWTLGGCGGLGLRDITNWCSTILRSHHCTPSIFIYFMFWI